MPSQDTYPAGSEAEVNVKNKECFFFGTHQKQSNKGFCAIQEPVLQRRRTSLSRKGANLGVIKLPPKLSNPRSAIQLRRKERACSSMFKLKVRFLPQSGLGGLLCFLVLLEPNFGGGDEVLGGGVVSKREGTELLVERREEESSKGSSRLRGAGGRGSLKERGGGWTATTVIVPGGPATKVTDACWRQEKRWVRAKTSRSGSSESTREDRVQPGESVPALPSRNRRRNLPVPSGVLGV